jgi:hypothetical protein
VRTKQILVNLSFVIFWSILLREQTSQTNSSVAMNLSQTVDIVDLESTQRRFRATRPSPPPAQPAQRRTVREVGMPQNMALMVAVSGIGGLMPELSHKEGSRVETGVRMSNDWKCCVEGYSGV